MYSTWYTGPTLAEAIHQLSAPSRAVVVPHVASASEDALNQVLAEQPNNACCDSDHQCYGTVLYALT